MFGLLTSIVSFFNHRKCVSLSNQKCMAQPTLINLHPNEYSQELHCYPFAVNLDRFAGSCNTLDDLSNKVRVPNKTEDLNLQVFNMITGINESRTLTKHISCKCECKFDDRKCNLNQNWNDDKCQCDCKNSKEYQCEEGYFWNPAKCSCENGKYVRSIDDSVVICDEIIEETKTIPTKITPTKTIPTKTFLITAVLTKNTSTNVYILLVLLLITIALLIAVSIYLIKHRSKQKHLLPYHDTSKLKETDITNIL